MPLDPTAVLAIVCACVFTGAGGYLCGYLQGRDHRRQEAGRAPDDQGRAPDDQGRDDWRSSR